MTPEMKIAPTHDGTARVHELKTHPDAYDAVEDGRKRFEWRLDDRGFEVGDVLHLRRWDPVTSTYTGRWLRRRVTYIARGPAYGIPRGWCVMSIEHEEAA